MALVFSKPSALVKAARYRWDKPIAQLLEQSSWIAIAVLSFALGCNVKPHQAEGYFSSLLAFIAKDKEKKPFSSFRYNTWLS